MLQEWQEKVPECALVCVLYDALYSVDLQDVANRHFDQYIQVDKIMNSPGKKDYQYRCHVNLTPVSKAFLVDQGWEYDIFICHTGADKPFVEKLYYEIQECGLKAFYDKECLEMGDCVQATIARAIVSSPFFIVVLSGSFENKGYPEAELKASLAFPEENKRTIPIFYKKSADEFHQLTRKLYQKLADSAGIEREGRTDDQFAKYISRNMKRRAERQLHTNEVKLWKPKGEDWKPKQGNTGLQALYQLEKDVKAERESRRNLLSQLMVKQRILTGQCKQLLLCSY
jgi:hypothetical protein